jgi:transposase-like protein
VLGCDHGLVAAERGPGVLAGLGVVEQRYRAVLEVLEVGLPVAEVARRYGVARQTVHEWLSRYAQGGLGGLADRSSRPASCPHQLPAEVEARIAGMRRDHPGWGPSRIRWELERASVVPLPGRSAVYRALIRHGLIVPGRRKRRREVLVLGRAEVVAQPPECRPGAPRPVR